MVAEWGPLERNPWAAVVVAAVAKVAESHLLGEETPGPFRYSDPKSLASVFKEADLCKDYAVSEVAGEVAFPSPAHYWRFVSEIFEPLAFALEGDLGVRRKAIRAAVLRASTPYARGRRLIFKWSAWVASGTKPRHHRQPPMRLHVQFEDQHGRVWHEHESIYPEPKGSKPTPLFKVPRGYRLGF